MVLKKQEKTDSIPKSNGYGMFVSIVVIPADAYELQFLNKPIITI